MNAGARPFVGALVPLARQYEPGEVMPRPGASPSMALMVVYLPLKSSKNHSRVKPA